MYTTNSVGAFCASGNITSPGADIIKSPSDDAKKSTLSPGFDPLSKIRTASPFLILKPEASRDFKTLSPEESPDFNKFIKYSARPEPFAPIIPASEMPFGAKNTISAICKPSRSTTVISSPSSIFTPRLPPPGTT